MKWVEDKEQSRSSSSSVGLRSARIDNASSRQPFCTLTTNPTLHSTTTTSHSTYDHLITPQLSPISHPTHTTPSPWPPHKVPASLVVEQEQEEPLPHHQPLVLPPSLQTEEEEDRTLLLNLLVQLLLGFLREEEVTESLMMNATLIRLVKKESCPNLPSWKKYCCLG